MCSKMGHDSYVFQFFSFDILKFYICSKIRKSLFTNCTVYQNTFNNDRPYMNIQMLRNKSAVVKGYC